ncbi:MAG: tetraacyldisaccharide 4'-kinase [Desulfuromusa sp.]|nr:tetraacyldisaccharide 4'-kinase [Desulfuromusa sp.]
MSSLADFHRRLVAQGASNLWERMLLLLFLPLSFFYGVVGWVRNLCYDYGLLPVYISSLPVISVGNLAVGGTGKTPVVDWLVKEFQRQGKHPAVVSRGYSGSFSGTVGIVSVGDEILMTAAECGDEPYLLARRNPHCPVMISKKRIDGIKALEKLPNIDVIILDDGFQHRSVKRDVDLVLLDASRPLGNGWPLPAGNLREFSGSLKRADFLLMTRSGVLGQSDFMGYHAYNSCHQLANIAVCLDGHAVPVSQLKKLNLLAFAGIADPENFFITLEKIGLSLKEKLSFADHTEYQGQIMEQLHNATAHVDALITTEKDAVKLSADMFELPCYQMSMDINIDNSAELIENISKCLWS